MNKVVAGDDMFFKDDIKIVDKEIAKPFSLPPVPVFRDELQLFYHGAVYVASSQQKADACIKVYTRLFGLEKALDIKQQEDDYLTRHAAVLAVIKADFLKRAIKGVSELDDAHPLKHGLSPQIMSELVERIQKHSARPAPSDGQTLLSTVDGCDGIMTLDDKFYGLMTIPDYVATFQNGFKPSFYKEFLKRCASASPEDISRDLTENADHIHPKVLPLVRNKIWHSARSFKLFLDGTYWIPEYRGSLDTIVNAYHSILEQRVKMDAAKGI